MKKLYLVAGHGGSDPGAVSQCGEKTEADLASGLVKEIISHLKDYDGVVDLSDRGQNFSEDLTDVRKSTPEDTIIDFHFNSFHNPSAHGTEVFYTPTDSTPPLVLAQNLIAAVQKSTGFRSRGVKKESNSQHARLAMLHTPAKDELLLEVCFISNPDELQVYNHAMPQIAKDIASCLIQADLLTKKKRKGKDSESEGD